MGMNCSGHIVAYSVKVEPLRLWVRGRPKGSMGSTKGVDGVDQRGRWVDQRGRWVDQRG
jgi:hypothetical protein